MFIDILKLVLVVPYVLVLPGFFFMLALFGWKNEKISFFEKAALVVPFSLILVDLIVLLLNKLNVLLRGPVVAGSVAIFCLICFAVFQSRFGRKKGKADADIEEKPEKLFQFSNWQTIFILLSLVLAIFIRVAYLTDTIVPASTDLGHHMYWTQTIIDTGHLPTYGVPDFIIGEHIIFAVVNLLSGVKVMTAMPVLLLLLFNVVGIFTLAILAARIFKNKNITVFSIFSLGVLYAISAPQGKYVSGGVVGNIIGDMLIPVALYFLYRAFREKDQIFAGLFIFFFAGLLYTHHLSAFVIIFSVAAIAVLYLLLNFKKAFEIIGDWLKIFLKPFSILVFLFSIFYFLFIFTPSYFNPAAVGQATGEPSKVTRVGLSLAQIDISVGSARLILGGIGFLLLVLGLKREKYRYSFALGWAAILFVMSYKPGLLYVNIPSDRVGNYLFLPLSLLAAYGIVEFFEYFGKAATKFFAAVFLYTLMFFVITNGLSDSADVFKAKTAFQETVQVYHSAAYLAKTIDTNNDVVLKDHVNVYADSWYKLFFMKDYKYPLSRGVLTRYVDPTKPRETCTRDMISDPESDSGKACFADTGVNYVVVNAQIEGNSFEKYPDFLKVYGSDYISVFKKN